MKNKFEKGKKKSFCKIFSKIIFSNLGLFIIVTIYACVGAYLFIMIELPTEERRRNKKRRISMDSADSMKYMVSWLWYHNGLNHSKSEYHALVYKNIEAFMQFVVAKSSDGSLQYDGDIDAWDYDWTFPKSLLFTVTSIAAIGYGHISPKTQMGRLFTILYNVIGIPLLLVFLANIGDFLANSFQYIYSRVCCRWCRWRRRVSEQKKNQMPESRSLWNDDIGFEVYMPTQRVNVPIVVNLCVIAVYLMIGGGLFGWWEGWDLISAVYFTFITLVTIGFGDMVPGNSFLDATDGIASALKMLATVLFCLFDRLLESRYSLFKLPERQMAQKPILG
ncbi:hypothetical protein SK128_007285 [Halocaridina rubra]|uniref:Potassium channel domain-containing protein n=1 Tax=Halocaridina rubra TaxID=373956 RepID=A0AAN9A989_HALRR